MDVGTRFNVDITCSICYIEQLSRMLQLTACMSSTCSNCNIEQFMTMLWHASYRRYAEGACVKVWRLHRLPELNFASAITLKLSRQHSPPEIANVIWISPIKVVSLTPQRHIMFRTYTFRNSALNKICNWLGNVEANHLIECELAQILRCQYAIQIVIVRCAAHFNWSPIDLTNKIISCLS